MINNTLLTEKLKSFDAMKSYVDSKPNDIFYQSEIYQDNIYKSEAIFLVKEDSSSANISSNLGGLASFAGINLPSGSQNKSDLINILNKSNYGLSCMIWSKNISKSLNFINEIQIGRIWVNGNIKQNYPEIPIGGFKWSGIGRETGKSGFEMYSEKKSVIINL